MRRNGKKILAAAAVVLCLVVLGAAAWCGAGLCQRGALLRELEQAQGKFDPQSIVLQNTNRAEAERLARRYGAELRITKDGSYARLTLPEGTAFRDVLSMRESIGDAGKMSLDYQAQTAELIPTRPHYTVTDPDYSLQTYLDYMNLEDVWDRTRGGNVRVAVIDTGIDTDHPEFAGRISELSYNATEDKAVRDYGLSVIEDQQGHGTAVAGVIAAAMDGVGTVGIAPEVELVVIKADCDSKGNFTRTSDLVFGLYYAIEQNARVINMSFGGLEPENPYEEATRLAWERGLLCVAAAGNNGTSERSWPAADEHVVGVGSVDENLRLADYSNYGENVDLTAPGTVYTTGLDGGYKTISGTSFSCPIVSAAAALLVSMEPEVSVEIFREVLFAACRDLGTSGRDYAYGYGLPDVSALVQGQRGTVTFAMEPHGPEEKRTFLRGIALQALPEPERADAVFDGWYYDEALTEEYRYYEDVFHEDVTLYAKWVNEDNGIPYTYAILEDGTVEIRAYTGHRSVITVPAEIDGKPVSTIGDHAFAGNILLHQVKLPDSLTTIGRCAFQDCTGLTEIRIPAGVTVLREAAFRNAEKLSTLLFASDSRLEKLEGYVFAGCAALRQVELPASLQKLSGTDFLGTMALEKITVEAGNRKFSHRDGVLFNAAGDTLLVYPAARDSNYAVPEGTVRIGDYAFGYARLDTLDLTGVEKINEGAFRFSSLREVTVPDTVNRVEEYAFADCTKLEAVRIGSGITILSEGMFCRCEGLKSVTVPARIKKIAADAFAEAGLTEILLPEGLETVAERAFRDCDLQTLALPARVKAIGDEAFAGNAALDGVILPEGLETVGVEAFRKCGLTSMVIPDSVKEIGEGAFAWCEALEAIRVSEDHAVYKSVDGVLLTKDGSLLHTFPAGKTAETYTVPENVRSILDYGFAGTGKLDKLVLPKGMTALGRNALRQGGFAELILPATVTEIGDYAAAETFRLKSVHIPDHVERLGRCAFTDSAVALVTFGAGSGLRWVGTYAFSGCKALAGLNLPETVEHVGYGAIPKQNGMPGDADGNGKADYADALLILRASIGLVEMDEALVKRCDMNGDGRADYADALIILRRSIGLEG